MPPSGGIFFSVERGIMRDYDGQWAIARGALTPAKGRKETLSDGYGGNRAAAQTMRDNLTTAPWRVCDAIILRSDPGEAALPKSAGRGFMDLRLPIEAATGYSSGPQRVRVMTERWVEDSGFCPSCGEHLRRFEQNRPVADFYCTACPEEYELKATGSALGQRIVDGAYATMIRRLKANNNPNFFLLRYEPHSYGVSSFLVIPKSFFVPSIIERRKALAPTARRAGWVGCNILMSGIPELGKIFYVRDGMAKSRGEVLERWSQSEFVRATNRIEARGWLLDVLLCVEELKKAEFTLEDVYGFEAELKRKHPENNNVRPKIRQQLQVLRDRGLIEFRGPGAYRIRSGKT
jgi:type II restriction enzyme